LLDRKQLKGELVALFAAIRTNITGTSGLSEREKEDCLRNLPDSVDELLERIAMMQNAEMRRNNGDGNHHAWDEVLH
jgi:hypothetical protein